MMERTRIQFDEFFIDKAMASFRLFETTIIAVVMSTFSTIVIMIIIVPVTFFTDQITSMTIETMRIKQRKITTSHIGHGDRSYFMLARTTIITARKLTSVVDLSSSHDRT